MNVLILGATGAVGSSLARGLAARGHRLALAARDAQRLDPLAKELEAAALVCDATRHEQVDATFDAAREQLGSLDGVAHCVGSMLLKPARSTSVEQWREVLDVNLSSAFYVVKAAVAAMASEGGSIVLVSSAAARTGLPNHEAIGAAKAGVIGLAVSAAATYANRNIRVNCVAPGLVRSRLTEAVLASDVSRRASEAMHPLPRLGEPQDVASAIEWLLNAEWVTGQVLGVDGGLASLKPRRKA